MVMCQTYFYIEHDITLKNVEESLFCVQERALMAVDRVKVITVPDCVSRPLQKG